MRYLCQKMAVDELISTVQGRGVCVYVCGNGKMGKVVDIGYRDDTREKGLVEVDG